MNKESELCAGTMMCCYKLTRTCDDFVLTSHSFNRCQSEEKHSIGISEILKQMHCPGHSPSSPTSSRRPRRRSPSQRKTPRKGDTGDPIVIMLLLWMFSVVFPIRIDFAHKSFATPKARLQSQTLERKGVGPSTLADRFATKTFATKTFTMKTFARKTLARKTFGTSLIFKSFQQKEGSGRLCSSQ